MTNTITSFTSPFPGSRSSWRRIRPDWNRFSTNLLINAAKYTPRGGRDRAWPSNSRSEVAIRVRDTGIGIEPDLLPKVFDLFLQGERRVGLSHEGGGIGLSLAKNLVELHGGTITARSQGRDLGSEFVVKLPVTSPGVVGNRALAQAGSPEPAGAVAPSPDPDRR